MQLAKGTGSCSAPRSSGYCPPSTNHCACHVLVPGVHTVQAVTKGTALLPCDIVPPLANDSVILVIWYKNEQVPIYRSVSRPNACMLGDSAPPPLKRCQFSRFSATRFSELCFLSTFRTKYQTGKFVLKGKTYKNVFYYREFFFKLILKKCFAKVFPQKSNNQRNKTSCGLIFLSYNLLFNNFYKSCVFSESMLVSFVVF